MPMSFDIESYVDIVFGGRNVQSGLPVCGAFHRFRPPLLLDRYKGVGLVIGVIRDTAEDGEIAIGEHGISVGERAIIRYEDFISNSIPVKSVKGQKLLVKTADGDVEVFFRDGGDAFSMVKFLGIARAVAKSRLKPCE
jgi:hypothetical protein